MIREKREVLNTKSSFWSQLDADIDRYVTKAKRNLKIYEKIQFNEHLNKKRKVVPKKQTIQMPRKLSYTSINEIRKQNRQERQKQLSIKTQLNYLKSSRDRKVQSSLLAKRKYEKVKQTRSQSLRDKSFVKQEIETYKKTDLQTQRTKATRVKSEKWKIQRSLQNLRQMAFTSATKVRNQSQMNEKKIETQKLQTWKKNKVRVNTTNVELEKSRKKLNQLSKEKVENGKKNHQKKKWDEYKTFQLQSRKNSNLMTNFKREAKRIQDQKIKAEKDLKIYQEFLQFGKPKQKRGSSQNKSFYITSY